jgi:CRISPR-associated endonuclease/helicase Cas3
LFSCLVDADFLDTEAFYNPTQAMNRAKYSEIPQLLKVFDEYMQAKQLQSSPTEVNRIRSQVLKQCITKAKDQPGIYTLTVPTGGGKTLSSMAFALNHAIKHKKRRIIYVIPYTSIIEQTAEQFRTIFGDAIIEHQSNLDTSDEKTDTAKSRLACENWDAPVIVTTSVQFFESLFASRTSRCRKLHNIVNSIVVLDEVQLLPPEFLNPILNAIQELQKNYGVTFLLSTATQPALVPQKSLDFNFKGLIGMKEIIDNPAELHNQLKRVEITIPKNLNEPASWDELVPKLTNYKSVLCIVNRRDDCRTLWQKMPAGTFHLSALMCGAHRSATIGIIKENLRAGLPTRVISTQLVEAGVDFDFPVVYRALAGLDSIAQAAGRCNREGLLDHQGQVVVFTPPTLVPAGHLRQAAQIGQQLLSEECADILALERFEKFFRTFYWVQGPRLDKYDIGVDLRMESDFRCSFRSASIKFNLIDDSKQAPVVVAYQKGKELIELLKNNPPDRHYLRKLQRYVVNIPRYQHSKLLAEGAIKEVHPGIFIQIQASMYDENLGYCIDKFGKYEPDELIN